MRSPVPSFRARRERLTTLDEIQIVRRQIDSIAPDLPPVKFNGADSMSDIIQMLRRNPSPSIVADEIPALTYDECLERLVRAVAEPDSSQLDVVARLIGRLAVTIE
jgi:hypothetical protein